jgi:hypothetical protein
MLQTWSSQKFKLMIIDELMHLSIFSYDTQPTYKCHVKNASCKEHWVNFKCLNVVSIYFQFTYTANDNIFEES